MKFEDRITLVLKSEKKWYVKEVTGLKPHTERVIKDSEISSHFEEWVHGIGKEMRLIRIVCADNENIGFTREVTDYSVLYQMLGSSVVTISWKP